MTATLIDALPADLASLIQDPGLRHVRIQAERLYTKIPFGMVVDFVNHALRIAGDDPLSDAWKNIIDQEATRLLTLSPADLNV